MIHAYPGPYCADIFNPRSWSSSSDPSVIEQTTNVITLEFTRVVLAIGVFAIGVELPKAYMLKHWKSLFFLLVPVMTWVGVSPSFSSSNHSTDNSSLFFLTNRAGLYLLPSFTRSSQGSTSSPPWLWPRASPQLTPFSPPPSSVESGQTSMSPRTFAISSQRRAVVTMAQHSRSCTSHCI